MTSTNAPCSNTRNQAFHNPDNASEQSLRAAIKTCQHCPLIVACANDAMNLGETIDGVRSPASAVIMAGVVCRGDRATEKALAKIAGVPLVTNKPKRRKVKKSSSKCVNCETSMVPWTRGEVPEGKVMHHARNYCTGCRSAYQAVQAGTPSRQKGGLRKDARGTLDPVARREAKVVA